MARTASNGFFFGFHGTLLASHAVYPQVVDVNISSLDRFLDFDQAARSRPGKPAGEPFFRGLDSGQASKRTGEFAKPVTTARNRDGGK